MPLDLSNKNIILISPKYFDYEIEIKKELERKGASVYFIDDRIKNNTINKVLFRLKFKEKLNKLQVFTFFKHHLELLKPKKIDYLIAITPEGFSKDIIQYYKTQLPDTIFVLYMWDSVDNRPYIVDTLNLYHKTYSFDKMNCDEYGMKFKPLFYTEEYRNIGSEKKDNLTYEYDLSFVGTAHSDRYLVIKKLVKSSQNRLKTFFFFYLQSPILIVYNWIVDPKFRNIRLKDISFKGLQKSKVLNIIINSCCVVDINHPKQTGLTIRSIEVLGAKRKLITTNADIITYDFYNTANILVIDRVNPIFDEAFLLNPYKDLDDFIYYKYFISNWIEDFFS